MVSTHGQILCYAVLFVDMVKNYFDNRKAPNYKKLVSKVLSGLLELGCSLSIKVYFLHSDQGKFLEKLTALNDEQEELSHQDIMTAEEHSTKADGIDIWWRTIVGASKVFVI